MEPSDFLEERTITKSLYGETDRYSVRTTMSRQVVRGVPAQIHTLALALLDAGPQELVLELAAGNGYFAERIRTRFGSRVIATDLSEAQVRRAKARYPQLPVLVTDLRSLPFTESVADALVCNFALYHVPAPKQVLTDLMSILKPHGRVVIVSKGHDTFPQLRAWDEQSRRLLALHDAWPPDHQRISERNLNEWSPEGLYLEARSEARAVLRASSADQMRQYLESTVHLYYGIEESMRAMHTDTMLNFARQNDMSIERSEWAFLFRKS